MKKLFALFLVVALAASLAACKKTTTTATTTAGTTAAPIPAPANITVTGKADGWYFAAADTFANGYRYYAILKVEGGKIVEATWDGYHIDGDALAYEATPKGCRGLSKLDCAAQGYYGMAKAATKGEWNVQAQRAADFVENKSTIEVTYKDASGHSDTIADVTVHVVEFLDLVKEALDNGPVAAPAAGTSYEDGYHFVRGDVEARMDKVDTTKKIEDTWVFGVFVVVNGRIVLADINTKYQVANPADATKPFVTKDSAGTNYGMSAKATKGEWNVQAARIEAYLVAQQTLDNVVVDPTTYKTDTIADVTIKVNPYMALWADAKTELTAE